MRRLSSVFTSLSLACNRLRIGLPQHGEASVISPLPADVREAEEVERHGLPLTAPLSVFRREPAELQETRLLGMQLQLELPKALGQLLPEPLGIRLVLESEHEVVGIPDDDHVAAGLLPAPRLAPEVEHIVEIDVREKRLSRNSLMSCSTVCFFRTISPSRFWAQVLHSVWARFRRANHF
jgi:hypothetical protein